MSNVVIVGTGLAGLVCAQDLSRAGLDGRSAAVCGAWPP